MTRWARVLTDDGPRWAALEGDDAALLDAAPWQGPTPTGVVLRRGDIRLLPPALPTKVVCVGRNYAKHAAELGNDVPTTPLLFLKPPSSLIGHGAAIELPTSSALVHHEGELAVVVGARLRDVSEAAALAAVIGYTCANDVTARDIQREEQRFTRAKGFDTFCPLGPALVSADEVSDPQDLTLEVTVDGETRQRGSTADMVFGVGRLLAFVSSVMTLEPGDVVLTGTPDGVGPLLPGQEVRVTLSGVGTLANPVLARGSRSPRTPQ